MYKLKKGIENFQIVDGPFAGRKYKRGKVYEEDQIPPEVRGKFDELKAESSKVKAESRKLKGQS